MSRTPNSDKRRKPTSASPSEGVTDDSFGLSPYTSSAWSPSSKSSGDDSFGRNDFSPSSSSGHSRHSDGASLFEETDNTDSSPIKETVKRLRKKTDSVQPSVISAGSSPGTTNSYERRQESFKSLTRQPLHKETAVDRSRQYYSESSTSRVEYTSVRSSSMESVLGVPQPRVYSQFGMLAMVAVLLAITLTYRYGYTTVKVELQPDELLVTFKQQLKEVSESFNSQSAHLWRTFRSGIKSILSDEDPQHPAVFLVVVPSDAESAGHCVIRSLSDIITRLFDAHSPVSFVPDADAISRPQEVKRQLDSALAIGLGAGSRVAIIDHLEQLHGESAMMLHAYCDNDNAPHRRVVILLVLHVEEPTAKLPETDSFVENRLENLWSGALRSNWLQPLLSRIANAIVFVRNESPLVLERNKC